MMRIYNRLIHFLEKDKFSLSLHLTMISSMLIIIFSEPFPKQSQLFNDLEEMPFENTVGKGENAGNQHFLLFPQGFFSTLLKRKIIILATCTVSSADAFSLV